MTKKSNFYHKLLSGFTAFLLIFQSFMPTVALAQEVSDSESLESVPIESEAPASEASSVNEGELNPGPTPEVTPTSTPQPAEILIEPSPTPSLNPEPSESSQPDVTEQPQAAPSPEGTLEPTPIPSDQTDQNSQTQDNTNQANAPPSDVNPKETAGLSVSPSPSATPTIETIESQGQLATYILENTSAQSAKEVLDVDPVNGVTSASLSTDKADYAPTDTAVITGRDFPKEADLKLIISADNYRYETQVKTDENGEFVYFYQLDGTYRPLYIVEVYDLESNLLVTVSFTDAPPAGSYNYELQGLIFGQDPNNESSWSKGNLCQSGGGCYTEGDDIPGRLTISGLTQGVTYSVVIQLDYDDGAGHLGYLSVHRDSPIRADTGATNTTITFIENVPCGGGVICKNYNLTFTATSQTATLYWDSLLSKDAAEWNGASLHFRLESGIGGENVGNKEGPVQVSQLLFLPSMTLTKVVDSGSATPDQWCFNVSPTIGGSNQFCIPPGQSSVTLDNIASGSYTITETGPADYIFASGLGTNCTFSGSEATATTSSGDPATNASCTFHNSISQGTIIVEKQTDPDGAIGSFTFSGDISGTISDNRQIVIPNLLPGTYTSTEAVSSNWNLTNISCDDSNSSGDLNTNTATFQLDPGETVKCIFTNTQKGKIIVEKQTDPDGSTERFEFVSSYGPNFYLTDGQSNDSGILIPGTYSVSEVVPAGWTLTATSCSDGSSPSNITLSAGEIVTCTFANTQLGTIILEKQTNPDGDQTLFTFTGDAAGSISDNGQIVVDHLLPGTYTSTENLSDYWDLTGISCNDINSSGNLGNKTATFNVSAGEVVKCTFTNTKKGHLIVQKTTLPGGDPTLFNINLTGSGSIIGSPEGTISDSKDKDYEVTPGTYSVLETVPSGWNKTADTCQGVVVSAGQTVTCTIINTRQGSITIVKDANPNDPQDFSFTGSGGIGGFELDDDNSNVLPNSKTFTNLGPGTYSISENITAGWDLTNTSCTDGSLVDSIQLDPGESIICTFTNTKKGHLIVHKVTSPKDTTTEFIIETLGSGAVTAPSIRTITGGESEDFEVTPGTYSVSEVTSPGWEESSNTCQDVIVLAGQTVECTIQNTKLGTIIVEKQTNPDGDPQSFTFNGDASGSISDNGQILIFDLLPGTYTSEEIVPPGWDLTDISCSDNDSLGDVSSMTATFNLQAGERVKCVFTNAKRGHLIVEKTTLPGGDLTPFAIQASGAGHITGGGLGTVTDSLNQIYEVTPGVYSVSELTPDGWDKTQDTCQNMVVSAGQTVTCTITNTKRGEIIVEKQTLPDSSPQSFEFDPSYSSNFYLADGQTNSSGSIVFGVYSVSEIVPAGWDLTGTSCSDGSPVSSINLDPGEVVKCTFTNTQRGTIAGTKFEVNADGSLVSVVSGWVISLFDVNNNLVSQTSTDSSGNFSFTNIVNGIYSLAENLLSGWTQIFTPTPVSLDPGQSSTDNNFGNFQNGTITGVKFNDLNGNGQDDQDPRLSGWTIFIDANQNGTLDQGETSTQTTALGYSFTNLGPNSYTVCEVEQAGWLRTKPASSNCESVTLINSSQTKTLDFGNQGRGTITALKNVDSNGDGAIDIVGATDWTWDVNSTGNFATGSTQQVAAGTYTISEDQKANYHVVSLACGQTDFGALQSKQISVGPGENVVCTFTNAQDTGTITIVKNVDANGDGDVLDEGDVVGADDWTYDLQNSEQNIPTGQSRILPIGTYTISEDQKAGFELVGWSCSDGQTGTTNEIVVNISKDAETVCTLTNKQLPAQLILEKTNNRLGVDVTAGADVVYTLTVTLSGSTLDNVSLIDLLPSGFKYRSGSWTASSSIRGDLKGLGITPEPVYSSPGSWQLGKMVSGETVTITLLADIDGGVDPGLYKDLSWAKGTGVSSSEVLANEDSGIFVGTEVNVVDKPQGASYDVAKLEKQGIAQVLGVSAAQLPQTGADERWIILAFNLLLLGLISVGAGMIVRRRYE